MSLKEKLREEGFIKRSEQGDLEITSYARILLVKEYSECFDIETAIMSLCERELPNELSSEETKEVVEILKPLADKELI